MTPPPPQPDFPFRSNLPPTEAKILELYRQYEASQWWPAATMREWQFTQLARLVEHTRQHVPFYTDDRLPPVVNGTIDEAAWRAVPILARQEVRTEIERLKSRRIHPSVSVYSEWTTGSSGVPLEVIKTSAYDLRFRAIKLRMLHCYGYDPMGKVCEIRRPYWETGELVHRIPSWEWPFADLFPFPTGEQASMSLFSEPAAQVDFLEAEAPSYLLTLPSNLRLLLRAFRHAGKRLPSLRLVRTMTERVDPDLRRDCQETLGVPLVDGYGSEETGFIAIQCPAHAHYHVQSELNLVEVLRDDGTPCQPGETGRVIVTPLYAFAMPLLRYDLGDYAEVGAPCPCGRGLPVLRQIHGRRREVLTLPSGERRYSLMTWMIFEHLRAVIQYQIVQKSRTTLEVRLVTERPLEKAETDQILQRLATQVGPGFEIHLLFVDHIPPMPGGKRMDFFSEVE